VGGAIVTLPDGTSQQTIHKQPGHGPYLWAVVWTDSRNNTQNVSVFSFWNDAAQMRDRLQANGHIAQIDLATDNVRKVSDVESPATDLLQALKTLTDHAQEQYPHFESERGQRDIAQALAAIHNAERTVQS
jgi:hypothetical protein